MAKTIILRLPKGLDVKIQFVDRPVGLRGDIKVDPKCEANVQQIDKDTFAWNGCGCNGNCVC